MTDKEEREKLELYYNNFYKEDVVEINNIINKMDNVQAKAFLEGYKYAHLQPHTRTIRLILMYAADYIPYYKKVLSIKDLTTNIREIFRNKLYPKDLNKKFLELFNDEIINNS